MATGNPRNADLARAAASLFLLIGPVTAGARAGGRTTRPGATAAPRREQPDAVRRTGVETRGVRTTARAVPPVSEPAVATRATGRTEPRQVDRRMAVRLIAAVEERARPGATAHRAVASATVTGPVGGRQGAGTVVVPTSGTGAPRGGATATTALQARVIGTSDPAVADTVPARPATLLRAAVTAFRAEPIPLGVAVAPPGAAGTPRHGMSAWLPTEGASARIGRAGPDLRAVAIVRAVRAGGAVATTGPVAQAPVGIEIGRAHV